MYEIIVIVCLAIIFLILLSKWPQTKTKIPNQPLLASFGKKRVWFGGLRQRLGGGIKAFFQKLSHRPARTKPAFQKDSKEDFQLSDIDFVKEGERLFQEKRFQEAEKYYLRAVAEDSENSLLYGQLGLIYLQLENHKDAVESLKMAVKLEPENGFYQNNLGLALFRLGRVRESIIYFENAVALDEKNARRWANLGLAYQKVGERQKAKEAFKKAVELNPANPKYQKYLQGV